MSSDSLGDAKGADQVDVDGVLEDIEAVTFGGDVGKCHTSRIDEDVNATELLDDLANCGFDIILIRDVDVIILDRDISGRM